jgi:hypothetical protein
MDAKGAPIQRLLFGISREEIMGRSGSGAFMRGIAILVFLVLAGCMTARTYEQKVPFNEVDFRPWGQPGKHRYQGKLFYERWEAMLKRVQAQKYCCSPRQNTTSKNLLP